MHLDLGVDLHVTLETKRSFDTIPRVLYKHVQNEAKAITK